MKRTIATLGVLGLGLITLSAPAIAASDMVTVCHDNGGGTWSPLEFNVNGIGGHAQHDSDIIPPTPKAPGGLNWTNAGKITYIAKCADLPPGEEPPVYPPAEQPPAEQPPAEQPPAEQPPAEQPPAEQPPAEQTVVPPVQQQTVVPPVQQAVVPPAAAAVVVPQQQTVQPPAAAPQQVPAAAVAKTSIGTNQGYNAQTAVGSSGSPSWLAGLGALLAAGAALVVRRSRRTVSLAD